VFLIRGCGARGRGGCGQRDAPRGGVETSAPRYGAAGEAERGLASRLAPLGAVWHHVLPLWGMPQWVRLGPGKRGLQRQAK